MEDLDRRTTYAAEDMVTDWLDAVDPESGEVQVSVPGDGRRSTVTFLPEAEPKFSSRAEVEAFLPKVMERLQQQGRLSGSVFGGREKVKVAVVSLPGWKKAQYSGGLILLPEREKGGAWALRGMVVLHELAHHLNNGIEGALIDGHGEGFRSTFVRLLESLGWAQMAAMLREAYRQVGLDRTASDDDGMLVKVGKLLRHAEGAATEAERDAFFTKAQELATLHSIELAEARARQEGKEERQTPTFELVRLGRRGQTSLVRFIKLMLAIARANDLRCSIRVDNTCVTLYGFQGDINVAKTLYVSLVMQMVADADAYIRSGAHRPIHGRTARASFYQGWTSHIELRLREAQKSAQRSTGAYDECVDEATGEVYAAKSLALVAKDVEVADYYGYMKRQHGVRGTWRGSSQVLDDHSDLRGRAAAERARLGRQVQLGAAER